MTNTEPPSSESEPSGVPPYGQAPPAYPGAPAGGYAPPPGVPPAGVPPYGQAPPAYPGAPAGGYASPPGASPTGMPPYGYQYGQPMGPTSSTGVALAEWWQRLLAILIDYVILVIPESIITLIVAGSIVGSTLASGNKPGIGTGLLGVGTTAGLLMLGIVIAVINIGYFAVLNGSEKGQTVGQMALGIAVRDESTGGAIGPQRAGYRILILLPNIVLSLIPVIGFLAYIWVLVAALSPLWDGRRQGFHDKVAKTDVVRVR